MTTRTASKKPRTKTASKSKGGQRRASKGPTEARPAEGAPSVDQDRAPTVRSGVKAGGIRPNHNQRVARV